MKYDHNQHIVNKPTLPQLKNRLKAKKISFQEYFKIRLKVMMTKFLKWGKLIFIKFEREIYINLIISTMILLVLLFHSKLVQINIGKALTIIILIVMFSIIFYKWFNKWLGRDVGYYEIVFVPFLFFYGYLILLIKNDIGNYIVTEFNVLPDTFNEVTFYISHLVAIQSSLIIFMLPLLVNAFIRVFRPESKGYIIGILKLLGVISVFFLIAIFTIPSKDTAAGLSYSKWFLKYDFSNVILCNNTNLSNPIAHRLKKDKYIWHDNSCKIYGNLNKNSFCLETCSNIIKTKTIADRYIKKVKASIDFYNNKSQN